MALIIMLSLISKTKYIVAWIAISIGFVLMAFRRIIDFLNVVNNDNLSGQDIANSWTAVVISVMIFVASFYIRRIFIIKEEYEKFRKHREAKILSTIIETEEKDRKLFSKELHDGLGPILSSLKMLLSALNIDDFNEYNKEIIKKANFNIEQAILNTKEISNTLSPHLLEIQGLDSAIKSYINTISVVDERKIKYDSNFDNKQIDYKMELTIYRIVCELINNTLKYAFAKNITLSVYKYKNKVEVFYEDDGKGFDVRKVNEKGMGFSNIKSRVKSLNGDLVLNSSAGNGMIIQIFLPL